MFLFEACIIVWKINIQSGRFQEQLILDLTLYDPKQSFYQEKNNTIAEAARRIQRTAYQVLPIRYKATKIKGKLVVENGQCRSNNIVV